MSTTAFLFEILLIDVMQTSCTTSCTKHLVMKILYIHRGIFYGIDDWWCKKTQRIA